jgi:signal transduction histidine kinase
MNKLTDQELIEALSERLAFNRRALNDLQALTGKLEATNRRLQESEALKGHFLSNIRNEINNPLTAILGLAAQVMDGAANPDALARLIYAEAFYLDFQMENIFLAAELEAGEARPAAVQVDVAAAVRGLLVQLEHWQGEKGVAVRAEVPAPLDFATDPAKLHRILLNLLANAVEFSPPGAVVTIAAGVEGGALRLVVADEGPGIDPALHEAIFDRFRQLDAGSTKGHRGQGLGLSVTRALAELLGGRIAVENLPGSGCRFTVTLPAAEAAAGVRAEEGNVLLFDGIELF